MTLTHIDEADAAKDVRVHGSRVELTLAFPPFPGPGAGALALAPHDPVRARQVVESLGTVEEVMEQLPDCSWGSVPEPEIRADLDFVAVGCWGDVVHIVDPALGSDLRTTAMSEEIARQRKLHPQARIVGSLFLDYGSEYYQDEVDLPGGESLYVGGWDVDDDWEFAGDPEKVLRAVGLDPDEVRESEENMDFSEPHDCDWQEFGRLVLGDLDYYSGSRQLSVFRVRRTEGAAADLSTVWF